MRPVPADALSRPFRQVTVSVNLLQQFAESSQLSGGNAGFIEELYENYLRDPNTIAPEWRTYFDAFRGREAGDVPHSDAIARIKQAQKLNGHAATAAAPASDPQAQKQAAVLKLVTAYRSRGHLAADLDPLGMAQKLPAPDLDPSFHSLGAADLDTEFSTGSLAGPQRLKLKDLIALLEATYANTIGAEFMHISDAEQRRWVHEQLERTGGKFGLSVEERKHTLELLTQAEGLERYLHTKYVGQKRFSLEGGDSLIPLLDELVRRGGADGVRDMVIGMAHRGRLNVLVNTLGKAPQKLFAEFEGKFEHVDDPAHSGDVKYHMGFSADVKTSKHTVHLALAFNPSHLEIVNPVVAGSVRARQSRRKDAAHEQVLPVLIHGDAALAGQGVNMELLNMSQARGFGVGGSIHIVINNQIGFTISDSHDARSTLYCTDVAKMVNAPVLHVNGDDPEAVIFCARLAFDFRFKFKRDVVIDLVCYRRLGHNEADEPMLTQPLMYKKIAQHPGTRRLYADKLIAAGVITAEDADAMIATYRHAMDNGYHTNTTILSNYKPPFTVDWSRFKNRHWTDAADTRVPLALLKSIARKATAVPENFKLHPRVEKVMADRRAMAEGKLPIDWGMGEILAYATLVEQGFGVRISGEDVGRGTFAHRHAVLHDQNREKWDSGTWIPLQHIKEGQPDFEIIDSVLTENAVVGFEYGYTTSEPNQLVIWEAQFGDFANGAQIVIDQFIASSESKWQRMSGLVLLLPHGYEGQGPEHSSARLERFLQLSAEQNMQVCNLSTPAQYFHALRRQMHRNFRKPLVIMSPKSLLRHKAAVSSLRDLTDGTFQTVIDDVAVGGAPEAGVVIDPRGVTRLLLCSGKVYYDLLAARRERALDTAALVRVEQLYPFPEQEIAAIFATYPNARQIVWVQEEPWNMGGWHVMYRRLKRILPDDRTLAYVGRPEAASPATGSYKVHQAEERDLVLNAFAR